MWAKKREALIITKRAASYIVYRKKARNLQTISSSIYNLRSCEFLAGISPPLFSILFRRIRAARVPLCLPAWWWIKHIGGSRPGLVLFYLLIGMSREKKKRSRNVDSCLSPFVYKKDSIAQFYFKTLKKWILQELSECASTLYRS